jgi:hypothetical protein
VSGKASVKVTRQCGHSRSGVTQVARIAAVSAYGSISHRLGMLSGDETRGPLWRRAAPHFLVVGLFAVALAALVASL